MVFMSCKPQVGGSSPLWCLFLGIGEWGLEIRDLLFSVPKNLHRREEIRADLLIFLFSNILLSSLSKVMFTLILSWLGLAIF